MNVENRFLMIGLQVLLFATGVVLLFNLINQFSFELFFAIGILAILFMLTLRLEDIRVIEVDQKSLKVDLGAIQNELDENKQKLDENKQKLDENKQELYTLISLSMGKETYYNLEKLASGAFGKYEKQRNIGLETELYYLRNLGYVEFIEGKANSVHEIPEAGDELSDYIRVTDAGLRYIELRESIDLKN